MKEWPNGMKNVVLSHLSVSSDHFEIPFIECSFSQHLNCIIVWNLDDFSSTFVLHILCNKSMKFRINTLTNFISNLPSLILAPFVLVCWSYLNKDQLVLKLIFN